MNEGPLVYRLQLQSFVDEARTPIEDASVDWPEAVAPYVDVGTLTLRPPEPAAEADAFAAEVERSVFDPWQALTAHRPLGEVMRARFRKGFDRAVAMVPNQVDKVEFELPDVLHTFKAGHRVMIQVQSSWFPLVDRNPQSFVDIYHAKDSDFHTATHRVMRTKEHPSSVKVTVLRGQLP